MCKSEGDRNKTLLVEKYLNRIRPYLKDIINNLEKSDTWKIQLTTVINFISSKDNDEECVTHSKCNNKEIMINDKADEVIKKVFKSLLNGYQTELKKSMKSSEFVFDYIHLLYYKCYKRNSNRGGLHIDSPDSRKNMKAIKKILNVFNTV